jgi:hypothetical protein
VGEMKILSFKVGGRYNSHCFVGVNIFSGSDLWGSYRGRPPRGLHEAEIYTTNYTEAIAFLKSRKISLYLLIERKRNEKLP